MGKIGKIYEKGERLLKKIITFCLAAVMVFAFFGCDETMTAAENFLLATKEWNMEQMKKEMDVKYVNQELIHHQLEVDV